MNDTHHIDANAMARILFDAWAKAEPEHPVTKHPTSYWATFVDMAKAALDATVERRPTEQATSHRWDGTPMTHFTSAPSDAAQGAALPSTTDEQPARAKDPR